VKNERGTQQNEQVKGFICALGNLKIAPRSPTIACTSCQFRDWKGYSSGDNIST